MAMPSLNSFGRSQTFQPLKVFMRVMCSWITV